MFQPFLRFYIAALRSIGIPLSEQPFQPFLRFYTRRIRVTVHYEPLFQPFLRFYRTPATKRAGRRFIMP